MWMVDGLALIQRYNNLCAKVENFTSAADDDDDDENLIYPSFTWTMYVCKKINQTNKQSNGIIQIECKAEV